MGRGLMSGFKAPQDRKPSAAELFQNVLKMQGANMAQKATLDVTGGKLVMVLQVLQKAEVSERNSTDVNRESLAEIREIMGLTREQVAERRSAAVFSYPDVEIQAAINEAAEKIAGILTPKADD
ncbi:hypothetical protein SEA_SPARCETUS_76 [Microbacterium phage Sparcetus]|nr:hypothetical protein SEA_SPARCETUS_76 [Microbacterium phage Sparcetus]